jgi:hypothetical protein
MQRSLLGLVLAGAAAYGYHRYSKMTPEQKADMKKRGRDFLDKNINDVKNMFGKKTKAPEPEPFTPPY